MVTLDTAELHPARIIPTSGIGSTKEQERRATSALLAVLGAVHEFGRGLTRRLGAPAGEVRGYLEVPFKLDGRVVRPDGLITVTRGSNSWSALVEVKTNRDSLRVDQIESYLDVAKQYGIDAVLTVSNQLAPDDGLHPVTVDRRKARSVPLHHLSWIDVMTMAVIEHDHRGVADSDQAWILGELIAYLEHPNSGALTFDDMGDHWTAVTAAVRNGTLRANDRGVEDVVRRWDEFVYYLCLELGRGVGENVRRVTRGAEADPSSRRKIAIRTLAEDGTLSGTLRIPRAVGDVGLTVDLGKRQVSATVSVPAPGEGRPRTRVNWLIRQLADAPGDLRIDARFAGKRQTTSNLLSELTEHPELALIDRQTNPRTFEIVSIGEMGSGRRTASNSFIDSVRRQLQSFYEDVVQDIQPWAQAAPRLSTTEGQIPEPQSVEKRSPLQRWLQQVAEGNGT